MHIFRKFVSFDFFFWVMLLLSFYEILTYVWFLFVSQQKGDIYTLSLFRLSLIVKLVYRYRKNTVWRVAHPVGYSKSFFQFVENYLIQKMLICMTYFLFYRLKNVIFFNKNSMFTNFLILDLFLKFYNYILKRTCWFYFIMQSDLKKK